MKHQLITPSGDLNITASTSSSPADFDFLIGKWQVRNRKLKIRLANCQEWIEFDATNDMHTVLDGLGNTDSFRTTINNKPFEGMTLRLFNPSTRLWSIYWTDSNTGVLDTPVVGSFDGPIGNFYTRDVWEGKAIIMQFEWDRSDPEHPTWSQAFSVDNGRTWEWNWKMFFSR